MGAITTGIGLISGIDSASLIESLIAIESRPKTLIQNQIARLQARQAAMLDVNARLLSLMTTSSAFREDLVFRSALASSNDETVLTATASQGAQPGTYQFIVKQLVATSQKLSRGFGDPDSTPVGLSSLKFELGKGGVGPDSDLADLNGGLGVDRGDIRITNDITSDTVTVDLGDVTTLSEVMDRINGNGVVDVTATVDGDHLVITEASGDSITITDGIGDTTATDLGIAGTGAGGTITGTDINFVGGSTALASLNDGNGVLISPFSTDFRITDRDGNIHDIDLGRIDDPITNDTLLSDLNHGSGIGFDNDTDTADIKITDQDGAEYEINLTGITTVGNLIQNINAELPATLQISLEDGDHFELTSTTPGAATLTVEGAGGNGEQAATDLGILGTDDDDDGIIEGTEVPYTVNQAQATTLQDVIDIIADQTGGNVTAAIAADGVSLELTDNTLGVLDLMVDDFGSQDTATALGIAGTVAGPTLSGSRIIAGLNSVLVNNLNGGLGLTQTITTDTTISNLLFNHDDTNGDSSSPDLHIIDRDGTGYDIELDGLSTVQDLIDHVNDETGGNVTLAITGNALEFTDNTGGGLNFQISDINGSSAAATLGVDADVAASTITGIDFSSTILDVTNRAGAPTAIDLATAESLSDVVTLINNAGAGVTASLNAAGTGIAITDTTGSTVQNLQLSGTGAAALDITADVDGDDVAGGSLQHRYVNLSTPLSALNYGRGIGTGSFRISDGQGRTATIDIGGNEENVFDIIQEINAQADPLGLNGPAIEARINDTGDGIIIEDVFATPDDNFVRLKIESLTGSAANDLGLIGESETIGGFVDGSYEREVDISAADTLEGIAEKINESGIPVAATIINTGSGASPYRLSLTSEITGAQGELYVDTGDFDLGLTTISTGADAKVFFGAEAAEDAFLLTSPTNSITGVIEGVTVDLHKTSDTPVEVTVSRDVDAIIGSVREFVDAFNSVVGAIDQYDFFNTESEERGILLGDPTVARVRNALIRTLQDSADGVSGSFRFLTQVGIDIGESGQINFDETQFRDEYAADPTSVESLFADFAAETTTGDEEIFEGITIPSSGSTTVLTRGFGDIFKDLTDRFTDSTNGVVTLALDAFETQTESLNQRIEDMDERLAAKRDLLQRQFAAMELALARFQEQGTALQSLASNAILAQSSGVGG